MNITQKLKSIRRASQTLRVTPPEVKNGVLAAVAKNLLSASDRLLNANAKDLQSIDSSATNSFKDRLTLNMSRINQMVESLNQVAALSDPVDEVVESKVLKNGLMVSRRRAPLGVIFMIFESRPNVAIEAWSLAFKAGNAIILRGGKESMHTTAVLYELVGQALAENGFSLDCAWGITDSDRQIVQDLLSQKRYIDVVVPRGGERLIEFVCQNSEIPVIKNDRGLCHVYIHEDANLSMASQIVVNAKTQRPGVCNAMETLLVHESVAGEILPKLHALLTPVGVQWYGCARTVLLLSGRQNVASATEQSFDTEYLDLKMSCRVVASLDEAVNHIEEHGSRHSESIVTQASVVAREFQSRVDAAVVYWNASTRFTDGYELGLGGELGISTQKLHVRGPVGLRELTSVRWVIDGDGQIRL